MIASAAHPLELAALSSKRIAEINERPLALLPSATPSLLAKPRADSPGAVYVSSDGVARILIQGALFQGDYARIGREFAAAQASERVREVQLVIDSPGGVAVGPFELAEAIAECRGRKPIFAMTTGMACSAAYALASAADRVLLMPSACVGSIGVILVHFDYSEMLNSAGISVTHLFAGDHKADGSPFMPLSDDVRERWQGEIKAIQERFAAVVARNRGLSVDDVLDQEAGLFEGAAAIEAGLADALFSPFSAERNCHV